MAYGLKYTASYKRKSGGTSYIRIYEDGFFGDVSTLIAGANPIEISIEGATENIYSGTVGSGATANFLADPLSLNFFTTDPQKYILKLYNDSSVIWQGFINSEIFYEDLSSPKQTAITLHANDGMAVLDMLPYRPDSSTFYYGFATIAEVLTNIFSKINISFTDCWGLADLRVDDYRDNIFLLSVNQENYIDESEETLSCRQVLSEIMKSFGLVMSFIGETIYIIDPINLHNTSLGQQFNTTNWRETTGTFPGGILDISASDISWFQSGIGLDMEPAKTKISTKYDPYTFTSKLYELDKSYNIQSESSTMLGPGDYYIDNKVGWNDVSLFQEDGSKGGSGITGERIVNSERENLIYYLKIRNEEGAIRLKLPDHHVYNDENLYIKASADFYANTRDSNDIYDSSTASAIIWSLDVSFGLQIGDKFYSSEGVWTDAITWQLATITTAPIDLKTTYEKKLWGGTKIETFYDSESRIADKWVNAFFQAPLYQSEAPYDASTLNGPIYVWIAGTYGNLRPDTTPDTSLWNVLIKDIKVEILDSAGNNLDNLGINYEFKNEDMTSTKKITDYKLLHGSGPYGSSRGAFIDSYAGVERVLEGIYRGLGPGTGDLYPTQYYAAQNLLSQYSTPRYILSGDLDTRNYNLNIRNHLIQWSGHLGNKSFYIVSGKYNDRREHFAATMLECASTRLNII